MCRSAFLEGFGLAKGLSLVSKKCRLSDVGWEDFTAMEFQGLQILLEPLGSGSSVQSSQAGGRPHRPDHPRVESQKLLRLPGATIGAVTRNVNTSGRRIYSTREGLAILSSLLAGVIVAAAMALESEEATKLRA